MAVSETDGLPAVSLLRNTVTMNTYLAILTLLVALCSVQGFTGTPVFGNRPVKVRLQIMVILTITPESV